MITVHHLNNSRSQRVLWLLEELALEYEIVFYQRQPSFAAPDDLKNIHPLGKAPVVAIDDYVMAESGAVVQYLAGRYGQGRLAPAEDSPLYAMYIEMLHYSEGSLAPPLLDALYSRMLQINHDQFTAMTQQRVLNQLAYVDGLLEGKDYLVGNDFTAADLQITFNLQGAKSAGALVNFDNLNSFVTRMESRPAYKKAIERGGDFNLNFGQ